MLLPELARTLYQAGLRRLNVHIDTLDWERFRQIARRDDLDRVLDGLELPQRGRLSASFPSGKMAPSRRGGRREPLG